MASSRRATGFDRSLCASELSGKLQWPRVLALFNLLLRTSSSWGRAGCPPSLRRRWSPS